MPLQKISFLKNPFIGLFLKCNDSHALVPRNLSHKYVSTIEEALQVSATPLLVNQSDLIGIFCAMNSNGVVMPSFAEKQDVSIVKKLGLNVCLVDELQAIGNNILVNDKACLLNPHYPAHTAKKIADCLGVETSQEHLLSKIPTVGSISVVTNRGLLAYNETPEIELKKLSKFFGVPGDVGSCNMGTPFNAMGVVANSKGGLVGELSSGFETQRIYEALFG